MRIAMVVGNFPVISQTFILNQIDGLISQGHQVDIFSYDIGESGKTHPIVAKHRLMDRVYYLWTPKETWWHRFTHGDRVFWKLLFKSPRAAMKCINLFRFGREALSLSLLYQAAHVQNLKPYDIVHCQFGTFGLRYLPLHEIGLAQGKLIVQFRGYDISQFIKENGENIYSGLFKKADYFLTNCHFFRDRLIRLGAPPSKTEVVYSGIDCAIFVYRKREKPESGPIKIGFTGRLVDKKGLDGLIRSFSKAVLADRNLELVLIGDGPLRPMLEELCRSLGVSGRVRFAGAMSQEELIRTLDTCHFFAAPSITAPNGDQDAPVNVLKEAMAMGLPVISTWHGGIPELVENGVSGFLVGENDETALAEKIAYLADHPHVWREMGAAGRKKVEESFDMHKIGVQLAQIYARVLGRKEGKS